MDPNKYHIDADGRHWYDGLEVIVCQAKYTSPDGVLSWDLTK